MKCPIINFMMSKCCEADLEVTGKGTTNWYRCSKCKEPAEWINRPKEEVNERIKENIR